MFLRFHWRTHKIKPVKRSDMIHLIFKNLLFLTKVYELFLSIVVYMQQKQILIGSNLL